MATLFYCGPPGSGKSYHVVRDVIVPALKDGRKVLTNLPVKLDVMAEKIKGLELIEDSDLFEVIEDDKIRDIHQLVADPDGPYAGCLIIIDEAHEFWPTDKPIKNEDFKKWYTKQRHFYQDVVLVTQDYKNVHKYLWSIVKARYEFSKNDDKGFKNGYNEDYYRLKSTRNPHRTIYSYDKFYYQFYYSHSKALEGSGLGEQRVGKKINVLFKYILLLGVAVVLVINGIYSFFSNQDKKLEQAKNADSKKGGIVSSSSVPGGVRQAKRVAPVINPDWCKREFIFGADTINPVGTKVTFSNGVQGELFGAHQVVGIIGIGTRHIYFLKPFNGDLVRGSIEGVSYAMGEKICL